MKQVAAVDLKIGDVVQEHGMRVLLDREIPTYRDGVKAFAGLVLNADELCTKGSDGYDAYIACHLRGQWFQDRLIGQPNARQDEWTIQGNDMHQVWVEGA